MKKPASKKVVHAPLWVNLAASGIVFATGVYLFSYLRWSTLMAWGVAALVGFALLVLIFYFFSKTEE